MNKRIKFLILALVTVGAIGFTVKIASAMSWGALKAMYVGDRSGKDIDGGGTITNTPKPTNNPPPVNVPPPPAK